MDRGDHDFVLIRNARPPRPTRAAGSGGGAFIARPLLGSDYGTAQINAPMLAIGLVKPVPARPCRGRDIVIATIEFDPFLQIGQS